MKFPLSSMVSVQAQTCLEIGDVHLVVAAALYLMEEDVLHHCEIHSSGYLLDFEWWQSDRGWPSYSKMKMGQNFPHFSMISAQAEICLLRQG